MALQALGFSDSQQLLGDRYIECSQRIDKNTFSFQAYKFIHKVKPLAGYPTKAGGFAKDVFSIGGDQGTHMDSPLHFIKGGRSVDKFTLKELIAHGAVVDVTAKVEMNSDYMLTIDDVKAWENKYGRIRDNSLVVMKTGWNKHFGKGYAKYTGTDAKGGFHFPGFSPKLADWLIKERKVVGVGLDTPSLDNGPSKDY
jgi:kynurenine formamidase